MYNTVKVLQIELEVPYPLTNGGHQLRHPSGRCPAHIPSVTYFVASEVQRG